MGRDYYMRPRSVDEHDALGPGSSLLHWLACVAACLSTIFFFVGSELSLFDFAIHAYQNALGPKSASTEVVFQLNSIRSETESLYPVTHPFAFFIADQLAVGVIAATIHVIVLLAWTAVGLPSSLTIRRRLREGRSTLGRSLGYIMEQYDDSMVDGVMGRPTMLQGTLILGSIGLLSVLYRYLWVLCMRLTDALFTQVISYMFIICVPLLSFWILREPLHGLKAMSALLCFIGVYLHFFASQSAAPISATASARIIGALQGIGGAMCLGFYLVVYRYFNPAGSMLFIVALQGIGAGLFGFIILGLGSLIMGGFQLPTKSQDLLLIFYSALWRFCIHISVNEAVRWGQPTGVAAAIVVAPVLSVVMRILLGKASAVPEYFYALFFTSAGFAVGMLYQFVIATRKRRERNRILAAKDRQDDVEAEENLLIGNEYTL